MIEVRRDLELPSVQDGDPQVVPKLAEALLDFVDGEIPGIGIDHTNVYMHGMGHNQVHVYHQNLILAAAKEAGTEINLDDAFRRVGGISEEPNLPFHYDKPRAFNDNDMVRHPDELAAYLRLHTADQHNGANVVAANSQPGIGPLTAADDAVYKLKGFHRRRAFEELGYDDKLQQAKSMISGGAATGIYEGATGVDTTRMAGDVYHYVQHPLHSVFFRSRAMLGSVTLHGFRSLQPSEPRTFYISNITAYSH